MKKLKIGMRVLVYDTDPKENYAAIAFGIQGKTGTIVGLSKVHADIEYIHDTLGITKGGVPFRAIYIPVLDSEK